MSRTTARIPLTCTGTGWCTVTLTLSVLEKLRDGIVAGLAASASKPTMTVVVAKGTTTISAGQSTTVTLHLNRIGQRLLAKHNPLRTKLTITKAGTTVTSLTITFKTNSRDGEAHRHVGRRVAPVSVANTGRR